MMRVERADPGEPIAPMTPGNSAGLPPFGFSRHRNSGSNGGGAFNYLLDYDEPFRGPLALGFGCHYGLGMFIPW